MSKHNALTTFGRSGNPMLWAEAFKPDATFAEAGTAGRMTLAGTVNKTGILLVLCLITASFTWNIFFRSGDPAAVTGLLWIGLIGGLVLALITIFKRQWAGITAPLYALAEGLALGGVSAMFEAQYPGIVIQAMGLTFGTLAKILSSTVWRSWPLGRGGIARIALMQFLRPVSGALLAAISLGEDFDEVFLSASGVILFGVW